MDSVNQSKIQAQGQEAVYVCRKCGWPFPNAHPSARHRRSHKKICGAVEGYKLVDSNGFGDEHHHHSDEDCKTPSPRVMERSFSDKGSSAVGERSNKSEDEVFTDAATEFSIASGFSPGVDEHFVDAKTSPFNLERVAGYDSGPNRSVKDGAITDTIQPSSNSTTDQFVSAMLYQDNAPTVGSTVDSVSSHVEESHIVLTDAGNSALHDSYPINTEKPYDDNEVHKIEADFDEAVIESSSGVIGQDSDSSGNQDVMIKYGAIEVSDSMPKLEKTSEQDAVPADGELFQSKEESIKDLNPEISASVVQETDSIDSSCIDEGRDGEEVNESMHLISVTDDILVLAHPTLILEDFKDHKGLKLEKVVPLDDSCERTQNNEDVCEDIPCGSQSKQPAKDSVVKEVPSEGEVCLPEATVTVDKNDQSDEVGVCADVGIVEMKNEGPRDISKDSSDVTTEILSDVSFVESSIEAKVNEPTNSADMTEVGDCEKGTDENCDVVAENSIENIEKTREISSSSSEYQVSSAIDLSKDSNAAGQEHEKGVNSVPSFSISEEVLSSGPVEENASIITKPVTEFSGDFHISQVAANDKVPDIGYTHLHSESSTNGAEVSNIQEATDEKINVDGIFMPTKSFNGEDVDSLHEVTEHEQLVSPQISTSAVKENDMGGIGGLTSTIGTSETLQAEADNNSAKQNSVAADISLDSFSQTDSLDANWGSVSVLSAQSDVQNPKVDSSDKSDVYDAPSFLTLVENGAVTEQTALDPKPEEQPGSAAPSQVQAGWFPSLVNVANDSPGRKKNEEIIAKVTSWSSEGTAAGKRHIPLKSLISEARDNPAPKGDGDAGKENDSVKAATTVNSILGMESPAAGGEGRAGQVAGAWDSPARYPPEIKGGKRKVKGRPIWAQFVCCSSVN